MSSKLLRLAGLCLLIVLICTAAKAVPKYELIELGICDDLVDGSYRTTGINDSGQISGNIGNGIGFLWEEGTMSRLACTKYSYAESINDAGDIAGKTFTTRTDNRATLWRNGTETILGLLPSYEYSSARDINDHGVIVGGMVVPSVMTTACVWDGDVITELPTLGGVSAAAYAINNSGVIVGTSRAVDGSNRACIWQDGSVRELHAFGSTDTDANDINDNNIVVGTYYIPDIGTYTCLWNGDDVTDISDPSWMNSDPLSINIHGQIVGWALQEIPGEDNYLFGVMWLDGQYWDISKLVDGLDGWKYIHLTSNNDVGQITGYGDSPDYRYDHSFLLTPIGELSSITGHVRLPDGTPLEGVVLSSSDGASETTSTSGRYQFVMEQSWNGTITPCLEGYIFSPESQMYFELSDDVFQDFTAVRVMTVSGMVDLQNYSADTSGLNIDVELREQGGATAGTSVTLGSGGAYTIGGVPPGTYDITFKGVHWLRKVVPGVVVDGDVSGVNVSLINGDCNNDNMISAADLIIVRKAYGTTPGSPKWDERADLNGDGMVSAADLIIVRKNYGKVGD